MMGFDVEDVSADDPGLSVKTGYNYNGRSAGSLALPSFTLMPYALI